MGLKFGIHIMRGIPRKAVQNGNRPIANSEFTGAQAALPEKRPESHLRLESRYVWRGRRFRRWPGVV